MKVELLVVPDCANRDGALAAVREAGRRAGLRDLEVTVTVVASEEDALLRSFVGSPTFLIDGVDPFAVPGAPVGVACRIYQTAAGPAGVPEVATLEGALLRA